MKIKWTEKDVIEAMNKVKEEVEVKARKPLLPNMAEKVKGFVSSNLGMNK